MNCKKCGNKFEQVKGLINYCSIKCKNGRIFSSETIEKIRKGQKKEISEEEKIKIIEFYNKEKNIVNTGKHFGHNKTIISKILNLPKRKKIISSSQSVISWRKRKKIELIEYKGGKCEIKSCGYDKCNSALEFHHLDPNKKDFAIGGKSWSLERLKKEVDKCILVCSNCHREIHAGLINYDKKNNKLEIIKKIFS